MDKETISVENNKNADEEGVNSKASRAGFAKINRPYLSATLPRERLYSLIERGANPIVWASGPPGSGKTTLIADYLSSHFEDSLWYQVDQGDSDIATLFYYLTQMLEERGHTLPAFVPQYLNDLPTFCHHFFRKLFSCLKPPFCMVFDNYQEVPAHSQLHEVMQHGLMEIPEGGRLIFISREEPPPFLARFVANSQVAVLTWQNLKLTREESDAIVDIRLDQIAQQDKEILYEKTQGWAAGLVLMLEALRSDHDLADIHVSMTPKVIFDYLAGEVFKNFDTNVQDFLLRTAILPEITAEMAAELTDFPDIDGILHGLSNQNLLISVVRRGNAVAYQTHPLLRDFLINRAQQSLSRTELAKINNRAANLLKRSGQIEEASKIFSKNRNWDELTTLILDNAASMIEQGRSETLEQWIDELPESITSADPWLLLWLGECKSTFTPVESQRLYQKAYQLFADQQAKDIEGLFKACAGAMASILYELDDLTFLDKWIGIVDQLLEEYPDFIAKPYGHSVTYNMYLALVLRQPFHKEINTWGQRTLTVLESTTNPLTKIRCAMGLASGILWTGRFNKARQIIDAIQDLARDPNASPIVQTTLRNLESSYFMLTGDHERCMEVVRDGIAVANSSGTHLWEKSLLINGVGSSLSVGDLDLADQLLDQLDSSQLSDRRYDSCLYHYFSAWLAMLRENTIDAYNHLRTALRLATEMGVPFFKLLCELALTQVLFICHDEQKGARYFRSVREGIRSIENHLLEFMSLLTFAQVGIENDRKSFSVRALKYALKIGREHNFSHTLWWLPKQMAKLAVVALENNIEPDYVCNLIRTHHLSPAPPPHHIENWPWSCRISTLGGFHIADPKIKSSKTSQGRPIELLKIAIAFGARNVSVSRICDILWPNIDADYANRSFNTTLHRLRKLFSDENAIILQSGLLSLSEQSIRLDTWALESAIAEIRHALREGNYQSNHRDLMVKADRVLTMYKGDFLAGDEYSWAIAARDKVNRKFTHFVCDIAQHLNMTGNEVSSNNLLLQAIEVAPQSELIYRQLMIQYKNQGRIIDALEIFDLCKSTLENIQQSLPSQETCALYEELTGK